MYNYTYTPVTVKVVYTLLSSPETLLQWAAAQLTLTPDFSSISLSGPWGCIDPTESLAEHQRCSPHGRSRSWESIRQPYDKQIDDLPTTPPSHISHRATYATEPPSHTYPCDGHG